MGDGKKWAAEQEEREREEAYDRDVTRRATQLMSDFQKAYSFIVTCDDLKRRLHALHLDEVPMSMAKHTDVAKFTSILRTLP